MWAWIVPLIIQFLIPFITQLITNWLNPPKPSGLYTAAASPQARATQLELSGHRTEFVNKFYWKFWYGPKRFDYAGKLFDKATANYKNYAFDLSSAVDPAAVANTVCNVKLDASEL